MKKAFTLVEISIILLIIAVLIVGVSYSKTIIEKARLTNIRTLTKNSPVLETENLVAWYEPTLDSSFQINNLQDGDTIATWYDQNTQRYKKYNITQSTSSREPIYKMNAFGASIPGLEFQYGGSSSTHDFLQGPIQISSKSLTFFVVAKMFTRKVSNNDVIIFAMSGGSDFRAFNDSGSQMPFYNDGSGANFATPNDSKIIGKKHILTLVIDGSTSYAFVNGLQVSSSAYSNQVTSNTITLALHSAALSARGYEGIIGEIIIYDRNLKKTERTAIEKYLSQKYDIALE